MCSFYDFFAIAMVVFVLVGFVGCVYWLIKNI